MCMLFAMLMAQGCPSSRNYVCIVCFGGLFCANCMIVAFEGDCFLLGGDCFLTLRRRRIFDIVISFD